MLDAVIDISHRQWHRPLRPQPIQRNFRGITCLLVSRRGLALVQLGPNDHWQCEKQFLQVT